MHSPDTVTPRIGRRGFIAGGAAVSSAALVDMRPPVAAARAATGAAPGAAITGPLVQALVPATVTQVQLSTSGFSSSRQEGGKTVMAGTFTPADSTVVVDVDVAGLFAGWGGGYFTFNIGVLPGSPPTPWEPGGLNRITRCDNAARSALTGVTEYAHYPVGIANANTFGAQIERRIVLDGLTPSRVYQWELRCAALSFFKQYQFADGAQPKRIAVTPDGLYAWVTLAGTNKLALVQLGSAELWQHLGHTQEMLSIAEIGLAGAPGCVTVAPAGDLVASVDATNNTLVLVDTAGLEVVGTHAAPAGVTLSSTEVRFSGDGSRIYAGGWNDGKLHRFDVASSTWDQATNIDTAGSPALLPLDLSADGRYLWCSSFWNRRVYRVDLQPATPSAALVYTLPAGALGPLAGAVREGDGSLVFTDSLNNLVRHVSSSGTLLHTWSSTVSGQGTQNSHSSVQVDEEGVRAFWTDDGVVGWAWIDSANIINATHSLFPNDAVYGDIAVTANEATLMALPTSDLVIQWPGGHMTIHPDLNDPTVYGADHAHVTFTGAAATSA